MDKSNQWVTEITRKGITYRQLSNGTLTCGPLDQSHKLGGQAEEERNQIHNPVRLQRIRNFNSNPKVLDFGCGSGLLVEYLRMNGIDAWGYDKYAGGYRTKVLSDHILKDITYPPESFDVITLVEVIEHTVDPFPELTIIFDLLKPGGILMVETSFTDWMDVETDQYIDPTLGHSTIFSHKGLDAVMIERGFEAYGHINDNVRVYQKPEPVFEPKISLITMGQANPEALKRTIESFKDIVDEIVFGDVLIFESDRAVIESYQEEYKLTIVKLPFNYIFENGFATTLNTLANFARHDWILYMNVSEVLDGEHNIKGQMSKEYNCYSFDHAVDPHRWFRLYNMKELQWGGLIHEEVAGPLRPCPFNIFRMKDTPKDESDPFKAKVANDVKELTYWAQYLKLVEQPELRGNTNQHWITHAEEAFVSYKERMAKKGKRPQAFMEGNLAMYLEDVYTNPEFAKERFESSELVNFQGDRMLL